MATTNYIIRYIALVVAWSTCCVASAASSYNLVVGDGGYARLLESAPPLSQLTLTAWVNITEFPLGVAPIFTAVAPDAVNQMAFFLRHDGVGVLWGGPTPVGRSSQAQVDRHPRQWSPIHRQRRDTVDYSIGLGDIEDILASRRHGRTDEKWSPLSFTDVEEMGVADLEAAAAELHKELHFLPTRTHYTQSESYNDWHNVPYELSMQESDAYDLLAEPEPRIITEPSGDEDDFVFINWKAPNPLAKQQVLESSNQWSPIYTPSKKSHNSSDSPAKTKESQKNDGGNWSSQVTKVKLIPDIWNTFSIKQVGSSFSIETLPKRVETSMPPHRNSTRRPPVTQQTPTTTHTTRHPSTSRARTTNRQLTAPMRPVSFTKQYSTRRPTTQIPHRQNTSTTRNSSTRIMKTTTNQPNLTTSKPTHYTSNRFTAPPTTPQTQRKSSTRMPLWKLINRPKSADRKSSPRSSIHRNTSRRPSSRQQTNTTPTSTKKKPTTIRPTTKVSEVTIVSRLDISGQKSKVSVYSSAEDKSDKNCHIPEKYDEKSHGTQNIIFKHNSRFVHEFEEKVMKTPSLVKEGDTAVVYSIPITDEDAFNSMYRQYQQQAKPTPTPKQIVRVMLQSLKEEENNENSLMETTPSFRPIQNPQSFQFQTDNEDLFQETVPPAVYSEEDAVLNPTEEPLSPTPPRIPAPKQIISFTNKPTNTHGDLSNYSYNKISRRRDIPIEEKNTFPITTRTSEKDKLLKREGLRKKTSAKPFITQTEVVYLEDKKSSTTYNHGHKQVPDKANVANLFPQLVISSAGEGGLQDFLPLQPLNQSKEEVDYTLDDIYTPGGVLSSQEEIQHVSHYQNSIPLYQEQLPPQYTNSKSVYPGIEKSEKEEKSAIYSADPEQLLAQGLQPHPVHYVSTPEEAHKWMNEQQKTATVLTPAQNRVFAAERFENINSFTASVKDDTKSPTQWLPARQAASHQTLPYNQSQQQYQQTQKPLHSPMNPMNVHFRKLPYNFQSNHWYHLAFTWSSTTHSVSVYINGNFIGNLDGVMPIWTQTPGDGLTILGQTLLPDLTDFDPTSRFIGAMTEVNLYSKRLTQHDIENIFNCNGEQNHSKAVTWHQLSMRFYSNIHIDQISRLCGATV